VLKVVFLTRVTVSVPVSLSAIYNLFWFPFFMLKFQMVILHYSFECVHIGRLIGERVPVGVISKGY
jgi:hypothetical protein